jgi:hypothetical protein
MKQHPTTSQELLRDFVAAAAMLAVVTAVTALTVFALGVWR